MSCSVCDADSHPKLPCAKPVGVTAQELANAERSFLRGLRRADGRPLAPLNPDDTSDLWRDGW
jgi:hypothetical protein